MALAGSPELSELEDLSLYAIDLTDVGARALINSPYLPKRLDLFLVDNTALSAAAWEALNERFSR
jgi:hypothetical protein